MPGSDFRADLIEWVLDDQGCYDLLYKHFLDHFADNKEALQ